MGREVHSEAVDDTLSDGLRHTIVSRKATAIVVFGERTWHDGYQVWFEGRDMGYVASEAAAMDLLRRLGGPDGWTSNNNWD